MFFFFKVDFTQTVNWSPKHTVKNSIELANNLKDVKIPTNAKLISLDVDSLFTNVDTEETITSLSHIIKDNSNLSTSETNNFCHLMDFVTKNNFFMYKDEFFKLTEGLPMGAPCSPMLADIFMDKYDDIIVNKLEKWKTKIFKYYRYVDDCLLIWIGTNRELQLFLNEINQLKPKLNFKLEMGGKTLNFLDLKIQKCGTRLEFEIYRKPSYTDAIIPANSYHSQQHKMSGFHALIHRLVMTPLTKIGYRKELDTIIQIAKNNGYEVKPILKILRLHKERRENKFLYSTTVKEEKKKWISIPYNRAISEEIQKLVHEDPNQKITFSNQPNLGRLLINTKLKKKEILENSGVYQITCQCGKKYVGQTGRKVEVRVKEHFSNARLMKSGSSSLSDHLIESQHDPSSCEVELKVKCNKGRRLNLYEQLLIEVHKGEDLLNTQVESEVAALVTPPILMTTFKNRALDSKSTEHLGSNDESTNYINQQ